MWKRLSKVFLGLIGLMVLGIAIFIGVNSERRPTVVPSSEADVLAKTMLEAIHKDAWDSTTFVSWTFSGYHHYLWDKKRDFVQVTWKNNKVLLNTQQITGEAWKSDEIVAGKEAEKLVQRAWNYFCNDAFWLNAPSKVFDPGTTRSLVTLKDGRKGLMVHYASGGVTPGDSYVWLLDENHRPVAWKMWVKILPIRGLEASWDNWTTTPTDAYISTNHTILGKKVPTITNLQCSNDLIAIGYAEDPFLPLLP